MNNNISSFVGESTFSKKIENLIPALSKNNNSVLLIGERGTGKRFIAQHIHFFSSKNFGYFFEVNCKAFSIEQIIFSFETVEKLIVYQQRITLFISFIDELPVELQKRLFELIENSRKRGIDLKVISSVENPLEIKVSNGDFSGDLYYKINSIILNVLPLRQRVEDILPIANSYLNSFSKKSGYGFTGFSEKAKAELQKHCWTGNIDELINSVQRAFIVGQIPVIKTGDLGINEKNSAIDSVIESEQEKMSLKNAVDIFKKEYITKILEENNWNQTKTAKILGIQRTYVIRLMNELQIRK